MHRLAAALAAALLLSPLANAGDPAARKGKFKKGLQAGGGRAALMNVTPEQFIKKFDKNNDGVLSKDELPPQMAKGFDRIDRNGDGKLDAAEVGQMLDFIKKRFADRAKAGAAGKKPGGDAGKPGEAGEFVAKMMERLDTNKDGKISRDEAQGPLAQAFDRIDANKDGFLDKKELEEAGARFRARQAAQGGKEGRAAAVPAGPDFDALDADADGRLDRAEVKGKPFADQFDKIDTNKDGKLDRKEFEAYFKNLAEKKPAEKK